MLHDKDIREPLFDFLEEEYAAEVFGGQPAEVLLLLPHLEIRHGFPGFEGLEEKELLEAERTAPTACFILNYANHAVKWEGV